MVIAAGGTGGHLFPALSLALEFRSQRIKPLVIGRTIPELKNEFYKAGIPFQEVPVVRLPSGKRDLVSFPFRAIRAFLFAFGYLLRHRPVAVIGMGGYASAAPALSAVILRIPLYFCEQNLLPGKSTRIFSSRCRAVFTSFPESRNYLRTKKVLETGNPLRPFRNLHPHLTSPLEGGDPNVRLGEDEGEGEEKLRLNLGLVKEKFTVLVLGGSQGAHQINLKILASLDYLSPDEVQFIHLTGPIDYQLVSETYRKKNFQNYTRSFFSEMELLYTASDLAICRSGATTIAELTAFGLPSILTPYPFAAEDHQTLNANYLVKNGAGILKTESGLSGEDLAKEIKTLAGNPQKISTMAEATRRLAHPEPAKRIVSFILS
ncbi:MAG: undecaprenyldiphospho-muramoylpentapeptide beta-N-acetylglucosaminyltransferase [Candidatus Omnitrophota bacterium]